MSRQNGIKLHLFYHRTLHLVQQPLAAALLAFLIYGLFSIRAGLLSGQQEFIYYNYLADAFLHGQVHLRIIPLQLNDLSYFEGKFYLYWPPMPSILLMPLVAVWGIDFNAHFFSLITAAINVGLVASILQSANQRDILTISPEKRGLLVIFFAFGTVHFVLAPLEHVWHVGQLLGFTFAAVAYLASISLEGWKAFFITGIGFAGAILTRSHLLFLGIWPAYELLRRHWNRGRLYIMLGSLLGIFPLMLAGIGMVAYNVSRFGSPFDFGLDYQLVAEQFQSNFQMYGQYNLRYLPYNFYYHFIQYPLPLRSNSIEGGSLFLMSPVFFGLFPGIYQQRRNPSVWMMLFSIIFTYIPIGLLISAGGLAWGSRYTLDFMLPTLLITAFGVQKWSNRFLFGLVYISMVMFLAGVVMFTN